MSLISESVSAGFCYACIIYINNNKELCESRRGRPGLPSPISLMVSVEVKQHEFKKNFFSVFHYV